MWSAPPGSIGLHTRIAVGLDLSSADDDPRLIFTDHQTAQRQCRALPEGRYSRWWCWPNDISYLRYDMDCWWMTIDPRGRPPSMPVIVHPRAAQHQTQHAETDHGCRSRAMVVVAVMMAMALAGKGRARQAGDKDRRERIRASGLDERLQSWPSALFVPHCCSSMVGAAPATHRHREKQARAQDLRDLAPDPCTCPIWLRTGRRDTCTVGWFLQRECSLDTFMVEKPCHFSEGRRDSSGFRQARGCYMPMLRPWDLLWVWRSSSSPVSLF